MRVYSASPLVPPEWIAAHGLSPAWLSLDGARAAASESRGLCPYAAAVIARVRGPLEAAAVVLSTACDQMRYAASALAEPPAPPVFLFNVPATAGAAAQSIYADELARLGRFLVERGGRAPDDATLAATMVRYERCRRAVLDLPPTPAARRAQLFVALRGEVEAAERSLPAPPAGGQETSPAGIPVALLGGPLRPMDADLLQTIERAGGRVVLDATETGERTLPPPFRWETAARPLDVLAHAYLDGIADVFRRPNDPLYDWLGNELKTRAVRGLIVWRYLWCDLWHAELATLRERCGLPVLELDVGGQPAEAARLAGRIEAFLESV